MSDRQLAGLAARIDARIPHPEDFGSELRGPRTTARLGVWLGVAFGVCFLTGLYSHYLQHPSPWVPLLTGPARLYQVTQGLHVAAGTAAVPLLLVKLWSVFPRFFERPSFAPRRLVLALLEKGSIALLVGAAVFQLVTGLANSAQWYPWSFDFISAHFALAWVAIGSVLLHVAVKLPVVRRAFGAPVETRPAREGAPSRRTLLRTTWLSAALAVVATTAAEVPGVRRLAVLAVRSGEGPQGVPINRSAIGADVVDLLADPAWRLTVAGPARTLELSLDDLRGMPQTEAVLPIACVEGWSAGGTWRGVRVRDLVALVGGGTDRDVAFTSLQPRGGYRTSTLPAAWVGLDDSLVALTLAGEPLHPDHGFPCRLIAPARPGVLQTKWLARVEVMWE
ncbi:molybdopterin-dependent oxidoreductase [Phycicoccus duodecadis]|uniref:Molybdopterin-dependent oxidoreductase-like protein n=1 Tax=Phycicoccus duodecadis TaxID=173053 RepID=A0A2N3YJ77_9MICO|nr:molybdopterin-dependent oxidoreductase [Phycicoccus duodecadis]PKW26890.1 molybdopterin-dependent oxidoreductase-like protein [Phycicoccus duodecadis]